MERWSQINPVHRAKMIAFSLHDRERESFESEQRMEKKEKGGKGKGKGDGLNEYERLMKAMK